MIDRSSIVLILGRNIATADRIARKYELPLSAWRYVLTADHIAQFKDIPLLIESGWELGTRSPEVTDALYVALSKTRCLKEYVHDS